MSEKDAAAAVDDAIDAAFARGKVKLDEMIFTLERETSAIRSSMRAGLQAHGESGNFDLTGWGRKVYVLESLYEFLIMLNGNDAAKAHIRKLLTNEQKVGFKRGQTPAADDPEGDDVD